MDRENPATHELLAGEWGDVHLLEGLEHLPGNHTNKEAKEQRDYLSHYYSSPVGSVPWQEKVLILLHLE